MSSPAFESRFLEIPPSGETFLADVLRGLGETPRQLPCKYFYDERGSKLFDDICGLDEYYLTRTELAIMRKHVGEMAEQIGRGAQLVEFGSGSSVKTRLLLDELEDLVSYVPVDISGEHMQGVAWQLSRAYPDIEILPVCADFTDEFELPKPKRRPTHTAVYFPGSTIGNFQPTAAIKILRRISTMCGTGGGLLIGVDLQKERNELEAAYNDSEGVTADFNLNLLRRINRELGGDFDVEQFEHLAIYNEKQGRIEIYLESSCDQNVRVEDETFHFAAGERVCTEYSHKYTIDGFAKLAAKVGLELHRSWTDAEHRFAVLHLAVVASD